MLFREIEFFWAALRFFTRLPVPAWVGHSQAQLDRAARYFPLVGVVIGTLGAVTTELAALVLPVSLAVLLGMAATLLATGAFHEDGLADAVDGFGGGWEKTQVLTIMKDSRIGSYGAIAIALALLAKYNALMEIDAEFPPYFLAAALVSAHAASRFCSGSLIRFMAYVREDETAKSKPLARRMSTAEWLWSALWGLLPCLLLGLAALPALALAAAVTFAAARHFQRRIGGYTGDCLGATQQLAELGFYGGLLCSFT